MTPRWSLWASLSATEASNPLAMLLLLKARLTQKTWGVTFIFCQEVKRRIWRTKEEAATEGWGSFSSQQQQQLQHASGLQQRSPGHHRCSQPTTQRCQGKFPEADWAQTDPDDCQTAAPQINRVSLFFFFCASPISKVGQPLLHKRLNV